MNKKKKQRTQKNRQQLSAEYTDRVRYGRSNGRAIYYQWFLFCHERAWRESPWDLRTATAIRTPPGFVIALFLTIE